MFEAEIIGQSLTKSCLIQTLLDATLACHQLSSYLGVHSKALRVLRCWDCDSPHQNPQEHREFSSFFVFIQAKAARPSLDQGLERPESLGFKERQCAQSPKAATRSLLSNSASPFQSPVVQVEFITMSALYFPASNSAIKSPAWNINA